MADSNADTYAHRTWFVLCVYTRHTTIRFTIYTTRIEIKFGHDPSTFTREQTRNLYSAH